MKSKKSRQAWWSTRTNDEKEAFIAKKQAQKAKRRAKDGLESTCKVFPRIDSSNQQSWKDKILSKNPWMDPANLEDEELEPLDYQHLQSIRQEIKCSS